MDANEKESVSEKSDAIAEALRTGVLGGLIFGPMLGVFASFVAVLIAAAVAWVVRLFHDEAAEIIITHVASLFSVPWVDFDAWVYCSYVIIGFVWTAAYEFSLSGFWTLAKRRVINWVCGSCFVFVWVTGGPIHLWSSCPLCDMAQINNYARAKLLLAVGVNPNTATNRGVTALIVAANECHEETTDALIDGGADVNAATDEGKTALFYFVDKCLNYGSVRGYGVIYSLLDAGANPNIATSDGTTALMLAAEEDGDGIARMLIEAGANPNAAASDGWTPLMHAAWGWDIEITKALLEAGANPNLVTNDGRTALMLVKRFDTEFQENHGLLNLSRDQAQVTRLLESAEAK